MTTSTIPRVELARTVDKLPPFRPGHWIIAGTPASEPYPCTCWYTPCSWAKCPDLQRTEGDALPEGCCGRRAQPVAESGFAPGRPAEWKPAQRPVEPSGHPEVPTAAPEALTGELGRVREAFSCDCETPWDPPPPALLIAAGKDGPIRSTVRLAAKVPDVRGLADAALNDLGRRREKPWKDGRHVLLPPQPGARGKTRPCWHATLDDGTLAVLDTPVEVGSGMHCECHRNFSDTGAYQVHRRSWLDPCKDPASILAIESSHIGPGTHLMKRTLGGVWTIDKTVTWSREALRNSR